MGCSATSRSSSSPKTTESLWRLLSMLAGCSLYSSVFFLNFQILLCVFFVQRLLNLGGFFDKLPRNLSCRQLSTRMETKLPGFCHGYKHLQTSPEMNWDQLIVRFTGQHNRIGLKILLQTKLYSTLKYWGIVLPAFIFTLVRILPPSTNGVIFAVTSNGFITPTLPNPTPLSDLFHIFTP